MNKEIVKYDDRGNLIYYKNINGDENWWKYDKNNNVVKERQKKECKKTKKTDNQKTKEMVKNLRNILNPFSNCNPFFFNIFLLIIIITIITITSKSSSYKKQNNNFYTKYSKQNNKKEIISELQLIKEKLNINNNDFIPLTEKEQILLEIKKDILNIVEKVEKEG